MTTHSAQRQRIAEMYLIQDYSMRKIAAIHRISRATVQTIVNNHRNREYRRKHRNTSQP